MKLAVVETHCPTPSCGAPIRDHGPLDLERCARKRGVPDPLHRRISEVVNNTPGHGSVLTWTDAKGHQRIKIDGLNMSLGDFLTMCQDAALEGNLFSLKDQCAEDVAISIVPNPMKIADGQAIWFLQLLALWLPRFGYKTKVMNAFVEFTHALEKACKRKPLSTDLKTP